MKSPHAINDFVHRLHHIKHDIECVENQIEKVSPLIYRQRLDSRAESLQESLQRIREELQFIGSVLRDSVAQAETGSGGKYES